MDSCHVCKARPVPGGCVDKFCPYREPMNDTLHRDDFDAAYEAWKGSFRESDVSRLHLALRVYFRSRRARALSEVAAADAELLEPGDDVPVTLRVTGTPPQPPKFVHDETGKDFGNGIKGYIAL